LKTTNSNESIDLYLTIGEKAISVVYSPGMTLVAVFSSKCKGSGPGKETQLCLADFDKDKVIGKGGFAEKVYLARKKDTGSLYAIKTMSKDFILEDSDRYE